jgi:hypothetical protein
MEPWENGPIRSLDQAIACVLETLAVHPERDGLAAHTAALAGQRRRYPVVYLGHLADPEDTFVPTDELELPAVAIGDPTEVALARDLIAMLTPLKLLNPIRPVFGLGAGTGTLVTFFGIPLNPAAQHSPACHRTLDQLLAQPPPDPAHDGLMPAMLARIAELKAQLPPAFKIALPDMQGPFNIAAAMTGQEALSAIHERPDDLHRLLDRITTLFLAVRSRLLDAIGPDYAEPDARRLGRIAECSVNMISPAAYRDHILPHDLRIAAAAPQLHVHPCSGPHVFRVTLETLPNVASTEAGFIAKTAAGAITVDDALALIGDRPIAISIGQELPAGDEEAFIRRDFAHYATHPRLTFSYTGMHWRKRDRPRIRALHRQLDAHWAERYAAP